MTVQELEAFFDRDAGKIQDDPGLAVALEGLLNALEAGLVRSAIPEEGGWKAQAWVKQGILTAFRSSPVVDMGAFRDKALFPVRHFDATSGVRLVPGGSSVRRGAHVAAGVVIMPPAYVNVGAWIGPGSMIDSHALVGSCAQIGANVHVSAGAQVGGVLEPAGARPVVVEDGAFLGGLTGLFEGVWVQREAVLASGVVLTRSTVIHDLVHGCTWQGQVPPRAVVVPGTRPASGAYAQAQGLSIAAPLIVKYRDARTDAATALEAALRHP